MAPTLHFLCFMFAVEGASSQLSAYAGACRLLPCLPTMMDSYPSETISPNKFLFPSTAVVMVFCQYSQNNTVPRWLHPTPPVSACGLQFRLNLPWLCLAAISAVLLRSQLLTSYLLFGLDWLTWKLVCWKAHLCSENENLRRSRHISADTTS